MAKFEAFKQQLEGRLKKAISVKKVFESKYSFETIEY